MARDAQQQIASILAACDAQGWRWELRKGGHYVLYPRDRGKPQITMPATPSDKRSLQNTISLLRRSGLVYPYPPTR